MSTTSINANQGNSGQKNVEDNIYLKKGSGGWAMRYVVIDGDRRILSYRYQRDDDIERFVLDLKEWSVFKGVRNGQQPYIAL